MAGTDEIRDGQRATWNGLAPGWDRWDSVIMDQLAPVTAAMIAHLDIAPDQHHLDVAAGTGEPALSIAALVPAGRVVLADLAPEMLAVAGRRASERNITNVETRVCSADDLPLNDASFGSVTMRFGYMFLPDLAAATAELVRVLQPGGRLCSAVWIDPERNPWTTVAMEAIATEVTLPPADPDRPSMYRCAAPGQVADLYADAGLRDIAEWDVPVELVTRSPEEYWEMISDHVSLAAAALAGVDVATRDRVRAVAVGRASVYQRSGAVRIPGLARCTVGTRPAVSDPVDV